MINAIKNKKAKIWLIILFISIVMISVPGYGVYRYMKRTPKITTKWPGEVESGTTIGYDRLVDIECKGKYDVKLLIDSNIPTAKVNEDGKSIYSGDCSGYIHVIVLVTGSVSESREAELYLYVGLGKEERKEIIEESRNNIEDINSYLEENYFEKESFSQKSVIVEAYEFPKEKIIAREYNVAYKMSDNSMKYLKIRAEYELTSEGLTLKNVNTMEESEEDYRLLENSIKYYSETQGDPLTNWKDIGDGIYMQICSDSCANIAPENYKMTYIFSL